VSFNIRVSISVYLVFLMSAALASTSAFAALAPRSVAQLPGAVGILDVLSHDAQVGIQVLDHLIRLQSIRIVFFQVLELLFLLGRQSIHVFLPGHVDVLHHILTLEDRDFLNVVGFLVGGHARRSVNEPVDSGRDFGGVLAVGVDCNGSLVGCRSSQPGS